MRFAGVPGGPSVPTAWRIPFSHAQASINDCYLLGPIVVHPESVGTLAVVTDRPTVDRPTDRPNGFCVWH